MSVLRDKTIVLGVSGGIAAYKAAEIVRALVQRGARREKQVDRYGVRGPFWRRIVVTARIRFSPYFRFKLLMKVGSTERAYAR